MRLNLLKYIVILLVALPFVACDKEVSYIHKSLDIEIESSGDFYPFDSEVKVLTAPDKYVAEVTDNVIKGNLVGETNALLRCGDIEYSCNIVVKPSYTYYVDPAIYLGLSQSRIESMFGEHKKVTDEGIYLYDPLTSSAPESGISFYYKSDKATISTLYFTVNQGLYVLKHLNERYVSFGVEDRAFFYGNAYDIDDCTLLIKFASTDDGAYLTYIIGEPKSAQSLTKTSDSIEDLFEALLVESQRAE